jgi:pyruvate,orthophosphate dikinase
MGTDTMVKQVYTFGGGVKHDDPRSRDKVICGGKGANLAEMAGIGLPVPPGFTITTEECVKYLAEGANFSDQLRARPIHCWSRSARARAFRCRA